MQPCPGRESNSLNQQMNMSQKSYPILEFANPTFLEGRNTTVRRGTYWHAIREASLRLADGKLSKPVKLTTEAKEFKYICDEDLEFEHDVDCRSVSGLIRQLQFHYPGFSTEEVVTLCHFNFVTCEMTYKATHEE